MKKGLKTKEVQAKNCPLMSSNPTKSSSLNQKLDRHFLACSAFVGTAALLAGNADAAIVYSGPQNIDITTTNGSGGIYVDLETFAVHFALGPGNNGQPLPPALAGWDVNFYFGGPAPGGTG